MTPLVRAGFPLVPLIRDGAAGLYQLNSNQPEAHHVCAAHLLRPPAHA